MRNPPLTARDSEARVLPPLEGSRSAGGPALPPRGGGGHGGARARERGAGEPDPLARAGERGAPRARAHPQADAALGAAGLGGHPRRGAQGGRARRARGAGLGREADAPRAAALRRDREGDPRAEGPAGELPPAAPEDDRALPDGPRLRPGGGREGPGAVVHDAEGRKERKRPQLIDRDPARACGPMHRPSNDPRERRVPRDPQHRHLATRSARRRRETGRDPPDPRRRDPRRERPHHLRRHRVRLPHRVLRPFPPTRSSTPAGAPSCPGSSTRTPIRSGSATAASRSGGGSPARATPRSRPRAAASRPRCAPRAPAPTRSCARRRRGRLARMHAHGTTTAEAKSGLRADGRGGAPRAPAPEISLRRARPAAPRAHSPRGARDPRRVPRRPRRVGPDHRRLDRPPRRARKASPRTATSSASRASSPSKSRAGS